MRLVAWVHVEVSLTQQVTTLWTFFSGWVRARNCPLFLRPKFAREPDEKRFKRFFGKDTRWVSKITPTTMVCKTYSDSWWGFNLRNPLCGSYLMPKLIPVTVIYRDKPTTIWVNYNNSLTWIKAILGWSPLLTMIFQWGRSEVVIIYPELLTIVYEGFNSNISNI